METWGRAVAEEVQNKEIINQKDSNNIVGIYGHSSKVLRRQHRGKIPIMLVW